MYERVLSKLRTDGICTVRQEFDPAPVRAFLEGETVYNAHVKAKATQSSSYAEAFRLKHWPMFCWSMEDVVVAPGIIDTAVKLLSLARDYFGEPPLLYSMNCFATQPATGPKYVDTHWWHRDGDDRKQLVAFFMLSDIPTPDDGAHLYQRGTHDKTDAEMGRPFESPGAEDVETITGVAGDMFLADTRGFHMAHRPQTNPRIVAWARFGVTDPPVSYHWDKLSPVPKALLGDRYPTDSEVQQAIHLVVR